MILAEAGTDIAIYSGIISQAAPYLFYLFLLLLALFTGSYFERKHIRSLLKAEKEFSYFRITNIKNPVGPVDVSSGSSLVEGQVVIASDYLKSFLSMFRMIFGGEMKHYDRLMMRARREAEVRMLRDAQSKGYNAVCNVRLDFSSIVSGSTNKAPAVEVLASGTAYKLNN